MLSKIIRNIKNPRALLVKLINQRKNAKKVTHEDILYWRNLKNIHYGKRGFVICNGPSLKIEDLNKLRNEITIASNKIYLAFEETDWRPSYYTVADPILWDKIKNEVENYFDKIHIANYLDRRDSKKIIYWNSRLMGIKNRFSSSIDECAYSGHTITYENLQIAIHLGLNPIYLIGCDHNYEGEKNIKPGKIIKQGNNQTHFIKSYRKEGELVMPAPIKEMEISYKEAKKYADKNNIKILNATRGGKLEIFNRINFDDIFNKE